MPISSSPTFLRHVTAIAVLATLVGLSVMGAFAYWGVTAVDREALARQTHFVAAGITDIFERLSTEQESAAIWDEAVVMTRAGDQAWMAENLGEWMGSYFGHDADFVLDDADQPIHAMTGGKTRPVSAFVPFAAIVAPYAAELRRLMATARADGTPAAEALVDTVVKDIVLIEGWVSVVSVRPIIPTTSDFDLPTGSEYLHVAVQRIDASTLTEIAGKYEIRGIRLLPVGENGAEGQVVPITSRSGRILSAVTWQGDRPGARMLAELAPGFAVASLAGLLLTGWLILRIRRSTAELIASEAQTQFLAFHDTLTGLPNRALFDDRMERSLASARRSGRHVALLSVDIDRFKTVNDTLGHHAGDELIRHVAERLTAQLRETDTVARLGGDEFALIQTDIDGDREAEELAARIVGAFEQPFDLGGETVFATASIGVVLSAGHEADRKELLRKADIALYEAKARGRSRYEMFVGDMDELVKRRRLVERELRHALETGTELKVLYQPLYAADGVSIRGAEALVRWDHPVHGRLSPDLFIGIAEERGLIERLGEWVLDEACRFALRSGLAFIAVNVSPVQFRNAQLPDRVAAILERTGLSPQRLQLEITEGVFLESNGVTNASLAALRETGVRIALDDFGTGYSSMSYLRQYGVDKLKIDRSFIAQLGTSPDADSIVRAMVSLARSLKLTVTAEGVETAAQRDELAAIGCQELQGYLLSRPLPGEELEALLQGYRPIRTVA